MCLQLDLEQEKFLKKKIEYIKDFGHLEQSMMINKHQTFTFMILVIIIYLKF